MFGFYVVEVDKKGKQKWYTIKTVDAISGLSEFEDMLLEASLSHYFFYKKRDMTFLIAEYQTTYRRNFVARVQVRLNAATRKIEILSLTCASSLRFISE